MARARSRPTQPAQPSDPTAHLERARVALAGHDHAAARDALIAAWRCRRSPAIAAVVDTVAERAPDAITGQLAELVTPRVASTRANLRALRGIDDPRISGFAIDALLHLPFSGASAHALLRELVDIVKALDDPRIVPHVDAIVVALDTQLKVPAMRDDLIARVRRVAAAVTPVPPTPAEEALARQIEPLRKLSCSAEALLADIYANPDDDAPRLVLADLLLERGDPRGELIALQIERGSGEPSAREQALLAKHGRQWMGNLAPVLSWGRGYARTRFRRGFVAVADIILSVGKKLDPIRSDPAWSTVEELRGQWRNELLLSAPLHALRVLDGQLMPETIEALARRPLPKITSMAFSNLQRSDPRTVRAAFPNLAHVDTGIRILERTGLDTFAAFGIESIHATSPWDDDLPAAQRAFDGFVDRLVGTTAVVARLVLEGPCERFQGAAPPTVVELRRDAHGRFERV